MTEDFYDGLRTWQISTDTNRQPLSVLSFLLLFNYINFLCISVLQTQPSLYWRIKAQKCQSFVIQNDCWILHSSGWHRTPYMKVQSYTIIVEKIMIITNFPLSPICLGRFFRSHWLWICQQLVADREPFWRNAFFTELLSQCSGRQKARV